MPSCCKAGQELCSCMHLEVFVCVPSQAISVVCAKVFAEWLPLLATFVLIPCIHDTIDYAQVAIDSVPKTFKNRRLYLSSIDVSNAAGSVCSGPGAVCPPTLHDASFMKSPKPSSSFVRAKAPPAIRAMLPARDETAKQSPHVSSRKTVDICKAQRLVKLGPMYQ